MTRMNAIENNSKKMRGIWGFRVQEETIDSLILRHVQVCDIVSQSTFQRYF